MVFVKAVNRTKEAIEELLSQQRLDGTPGLEVRFTAQNQLCLNTWRPTRAAIPADLLAERVPGFRVGVPYMFKVTFTETNAITHHRYVGGETWLPTVPKNVGKPNDVAHINVELYELDTFYSTYSNLMFRNEALFPYMTDQAIVRISRNGK